MGTVNILPHEQVLEGLLSNIVEINIREYLCIQTEIKITQKHITVAVVKNFIETAKNQKMNIARKNGNVYLYNGACWKQIEGEDLKQFLGKCAIKTGIHESEALHYEFKDKLLKQFFTDAHFSKPKPKVENILINLKNGTFEFSPTGWKLRNFDPDDFLTYQLDFMYDEFAKYPKFDVFLNKVLPDLDSQILLQEFSGYIFTNFNFEKLLMLIGQGANGKSVFFDILCAIIGKENLLNYSIGQFSHEYNRAKLENILLNYSSERGTELDVDILKQLVSSEPLQAREPYGKSFTLYNKARFIINSNSLPKVTEQTEAYFRRWQIINFDVIIPESDRDPDLANKIIKTELPGVFNWILIGLDRIINNKKFSISQKSEIAVADFKRKTDSVALFIEETNRNKSTNKKESLADLYREYKTYCQDDGYKPFGKNNFSERLVIKGYEKCRGSDGASGFFMERNNVVLPIQNFSNSENGDTLKEELQIAF
jgi:putative DNA primase/helicase